MRWMIGVAVLAAVCGAAFGQARTAAPPKPTVAQTLDDQEREIQHLKKRLASLEAKVEAMDRVLAAIKSDPKLAGTLEKQADMERSVDEGAVSTGMTLEQVDRALKSKSRLLGESEGRQEYLWYVSGSRATTNTRVHNATEGYVAETVIAQVERGKVVSYERYQGEVRR